MSSWLLDRGGGIRPRARVVCLPYAGGGTAIFQPWVRLLPPDVALMMVRLPGRESRFDEPAVTGIDELVDELAPVVAGRTDAPLVLWGYSLGALVAYELAARLARLAAPPGLLIVGGAEAAHLSRRRPPVSDLDDDHFVAELKALEGTPAEVFDSPELLALILPTLRADFRLFDRYVHRGHPKLSCPIVTLSGSSDPELDGERVARWSELTSAATTHRRFAGGHFFLNERLAEVVSALVADLDLTRVGE